MPRIFDADTNAWYEPGQLPPLPQKPPVQRALSLDPSLGMLPMLPFYQPPEETAQPRGLSPLPPVPQMKLDRPALRPSPAYAPPSLSLAPIPDLAGMPATTADPMKVAEAIQAQPRPAPLPEGFSWEGQSGRVFNLTPEAGARLRSGYQQMRERMGGSLGALGGLDEDPAKTASGLMAALSEFMEPEQAAQLALGVHKGELDRLSAEERQRLGLEARAKRRGAGGALAPSKLPLSKVERAMSNEDERFVKGERDNIQNTIGFRKLNEAEQAATQLESSVNLKSGVADLQAIKMMIKTTEDRISDSDFRYAQGAGGLMSQLSNLFGYVAQGGKRDEEYMRQVADLARAMRATIRRQKLEGAARLRQNVASSPHAFVGGDEMRRAWADWAYGTAAGESIQPPGGGGGTPGTPASDVDAELDDLNSK